MSVQNTVSTLLARMGLKVTRHMQTEEAINLFLTSLRGLRSEYTVMWYDTLLAPVTEFFGGRDVQTITITELRAYRAYIAGRERRDTSAKSATGQKKQKGRKLSSFTVNAAIRAVRRLFKWLHDEGITETNLARKLETPPLPRSTRTGIPDDDAEKMIAAARESSIRDYALLLFVRDSGCRVGGVAGLRISKLSLASRDPMERLRTMVVEKGNIEREVYFSEATAEALEQWLDARPEWASHDFVFCTYGGKPLAKGSIYEVYRRLAKTAGVEKSWSPHQWRHAAIRRLLRRGASLQHASQFAGHRDIYITSAYYGSLAGREIQETYMKLVGNQVTDQPPDRPD